MIVAIAVAFISFQKVVHQNEPKTLYGDAIDLPKNNTIDSKLLIGSSIFGIGWGGIFIVMILLYAVIKILLIFL